MTLVGLLLIPLVTVVLAGENDLARELGYGDSYGSDAPSYGYGVGYAPDSRWQVGSSPSPAGDGGGSSVRPLLLGVLLGALVKIPLLLLGKLLLVKLAVPLAVMAALLPLGVLAIYRATVGMQSGPTGNSTSRLIPQECLQAAACGIGTLAPKSAVPSTTWLLKSIAESGEQEWSSRGDILAYRDAYIKGATTKSCHEYPCPFFS